MSALYNEIEPYPAAWIRNLIAAGHVAPGVVDERSIVELRATDLRGVAQFHAFAGIAVWSHALRLAGWSDDRAIWTASLPCQPFSSAGRRRGTNDERHLWPVYFELVRECRPDLVLGEQVSSPDGRAWFDAVSTDLEGAGYAVGALNTCAAGVGAPHIRQRLYWCAVADADRTGPQGRGERGDGTDQRSARAGRVDDGLSDAARLGWGQGRVPEGSADRQGPGPADGGRMGDADSLDTGRDGRAAHRAEAASGGGRRVDGPDGDEPRASGRALGMGDADGQRRDGERVRVLAGEARSDRAQTAGAGVGSERRDPWAPVEWIDCTDGKRRPAQPGVRPLATRTPGRVGQLRAYGNGLCAPQAAAFVRAVMDVLEEST